MRPIQLLILAITFSLGCAASVMTSHLVEASREERCGSEAVVCPDGCPEDAVTFQAHQSR